MSMLKALAAAGVMLAALIPNVATSAETVTCVGSLGSGSGVLEDETIRVRKRGNSASVAFGPIGTNYRWPTLVVITLSATADYTPPSPTWLLVRIRAGENSGIPGENPIVAQADAYRDGNAQDMPFSTTVAATHVTYTTTSTAFHMSATAVGPGAAGVKNMNLCVHIRALAPAA